MTIQSKKEKKNEEQLEAKWLRIIGIAVDHHKNK